MENLGEEGMSRLIVGDVTGECDEFALLDLLLESDPLGDCVEFTSTGGSHCPAGACSRN